MDKKVCQKFENVWDAFPDTLTNDKYHEFKSNNILNSHCDNNQCEDDIKKISAGFFYLLSGFFGDPKSFNFDEKSKNDIFYYIIIWLSYMLNLKKNELNNSLEYFYKIDISNQYKYTNSIAGFKEYSSYKDLLDKKKIVNMDIKAISKFYAPFKSLCNMYNEFNETKPNCDKCLEKAKEFVEAYEKLNGDSSITNDSSCNKLLCTLSTDYDNFKKKYDDIQSCNSSPLPTIKKSEKCVQRSHLILEQISGDTSSSSIGNKLFTVNNKELKKKYYIYANINKENVCFLTFYISIRYLDFGNDLKNNK
ncbi:hypothetical protein YYC_04786 [Plasmodium yoelii 17X]|uniref:Uncharacterized protein n=1 Tax=Plasmodium yoelii 17X TaxID=1323249 RepID=V7PD79_PLAYE|nr:hypothetical protein YYC_04786 [Plasmodium yoelii 17X]